MGTCTNEHLKQVKRVQKQKAPEMKTTVRLSEYSALFLHNTENNNTIHASGGFRGVKYVFKC